MPQKIAVILQQYSDAIKITIYCARKKIQSEIIIKMKKLNFD